jgi:hypothetical protein
VTTVALSALRRPSILGAPSFRAVGSSCEVFGSKLQPAAATAHTTAAAELTFIPTPPSYRQALVGRS